MRVLITGVTGFVGSHLAEYLLARGDVEVYGLHRWRSRMDNLEDLKGAGRLNPVAENSSITSVAALEALIAERAQADKLNLLEGDMTDPFSMQHIVGAVRPERIFHLAAQSYVPGSQNAPASTLHTNILGEVNLFEAVRGARLDCRIQIAGSSEEYGLVLPEETPIKETNPLRPLSPYGVSKVAQDRLAYQYFMSHGLKAVITRGFNHTGPRRGQVFVTSGLARQIAEIEKGLRPPMILVGDLTSKRDWTDVRDMLRAYWLALEAAEPGEVYNIGRGVAYSVDEMLSILLSMSGCRIEVRRDPTRYRPSDVKLLLADVSKFQSATGWKPEIPLEETLCDLLNYWRERV